MSRHLYGLGELYESSTRLGRVKYDVLAQERTQPAPVMGNPGARAPALGLVTGRIEPLDGLDLFPIFERSAELTVVLEGGERWEFCLRDPDCEAMPGRLAPQE